MPRPKLAQRSDGRFKCSYRGKYFYGKTSQEAYAKRDAYKRQVQQGMRPENVTVSAYAEHWLPIAKPDVAPKTYNTCIHLLNVLCDEVGDEIIRDVRPSSIKRVYSTHLKGLSSTYIRHAKNLYTGLFDAAIADGLAISNPCKEKAAQPHKGETGSHRAITEQERWTIEHIATDHPVHAVVMTMLYAGLRPAEAKALSMDDVDMEKGRIHVKAYLRADGSNKRVISDKMKTKKSNRVVPLFSPLKKALENHEGLLITCEDGTPISETGWRRAWHSYKATIETALNGITKRWYGRTKAQKAMKKAGTLPEWRTFDVVPYDLRHSFVTWCRDNGVELHTCVEWCGHADATMVLKIYDEVSFDRSKKEAERLEKIIQKDEAKTALQGQNEGQASSEQAVSEAPQQVHETRTSTS